MASQPVVFDAVVPMDAPPAVAAESANAFQHVDAVMKEDDVSTVGFDSNDWELVAEMVVDTENSATEFLQSRHMVDLEVPAGNLEGIIQVHGRLYGAFEFGNGCRWRRSRLQARGSGIRCCCGLYYG